MSHEPKYLVVGFGSETIVGEISQEDVAKIQTHATPVIRVSKALRIREVVVPVPSPLSQTLQPRTMCSIAPLLPSTGKALEELQAEAVINLQRACWYQIVQEERYQDFVRGIRG